MLTAKAYTVIFHLEVMQSRDEMLNVSVKPFHFQILEAFLASSLAFNTG